MVFAYVFGLELFEHVADHGGTCVCRYALLKSLYVFFLLIVHSQTEHILHQLSNYFAISLLLGQARNAEMVMPFDFGL